MTQISNQPSCPCCGAPIDPVNVVIDEATGLVAHGGQTARLPPAETEILQALLAAYPRFLTKEAIYDRLYSLRHDHEQPSARIIDVFVCKIRAKLDPLGILVMTQWGRGYGLTFGNPEAAKAIDDANIARRTRRQWRLEDDDRVRELYAAGFGLTAIAQQLGVSYAAANRALVRLGVYRDRRAGGPA